MKRILEGEATENRGLFWFSGKWFFAFGWWPGKSGRAWIFYVAFPFGFETNRIRGGTGVDAFFA